MGSTTQRYSADSSPESPSSPSRAIFGKAAWSFFSINFWQRTSSSSLMSCEVISLAFFSAVRFLIMTAPAARAASTTAARALVDEMRSISLAFESLQRYRHVLQFGFQIDGALLVFGENLWGNFLDKVRVREFLFGLLDVALEFFFF